MGIEELLGSPYIEFDLSVKEVKDEEVVTIPSINKYKIQELAPFNYKAGEVYNIKYGENGFLITSPKGEMYFKPIHGKPIRVKGDMNEFIKRYLERKEDRFKILLANEKLVAYVRVHGHDKKHIFATLDVVVTDENALPEEVTINFEAAYYILVNFTTKTGQIVEARYYPNLNQPGFFPKHKPDYAKKVELPDDIFNLAKSEAMVKSKKFVRLSSASMQYVIENCFH